MCLCVPLYACCSAMCFRFSVSIQKRTHTFCVYSDLKFESFDLKIYVQPLKSNKMNNWNGNCILRTNVSPQTINMKKARVRRGNEWEQKKKNVHIKREKWNTRNTRAYSCHILHGIGFMYSEYWQALGDMILYFKRATICKICIVGYKDSG